MSTDTEELEALGYYVNEWGEVCERGDERPEDRFPVTTPHWLSGESLAEACRDDLTDIQA